MGREFISKRIPDFYLGRIIKEYREKNNLTGKEFINIIGENFSSSYLTKIEKYEEIPSPDIVIKIAKVCNLHVRAALSNAKFFLLTRYADELDKRYKE